LILRQKVQEIPKHESSLATIVIWFDNG
jgi:hypothetical protein